MIRLLEHPTQKTAEDLLSALPAGLHTAYALLPLLDVHGLDGVWVQTDGKNRPAAVLVKPKVGFLRIAAAENADFEELRAFLSGFPIGTYLQTTPAVFEQLHIVPIFQNSVMRLCAAPPAPAHKTVYVYDNFRPMYDLSLCTLSDTTDGLSEAVRENLYNEWLSRTSRGVFHGFTRVAASYTGENVLAATAFADILGDYAYLREVACAPALRRRGYASSCVRTLCRDLKKDGIQHIFLSCTAENELFYQKSGFQKCADLETGFLT